MSRLGDLLNTERLRRKMTPKQVAKMAGVSEKYLLEVESGKRIIADDQARRILKLIGLTQQTESNFSLDDIAATVDLSSVGGAMEKQIKQAPPEEKQRVVASAGEDARGGIWLDALAGVLRHVPIYNAVMKEVSHRVLPVLDGKIEGAAPDKVFYFEAPDDSMRGFRICQGDRALIVPAQSPVDDAIMLAERDGHRALYKVRKLDATHVLLQNYGRAYESVSVALGEIKLLGRVVRVEIELA